LPGRNHHHDILVIGASAGGVEAVRDLVRELPRDLPAAVLVVVHLDPSSDSRLAEILSSEHGLRASAARHGDTIQPGHVWVAPPDHHLMVRPGHLEVVRGPRENGHRPAVDVLFRTAAAAYGPRVVGVVLTGYLDCGTAGLMSIKARGGLAVAQDPTDAFAASMPASAIRNVRVDRVATLDDMPHVLEELVRRPAGPAAEPVEREVEQMEGHQVGSSDVELVCPNCQGKLTVSESAGFSTFRCHVGHAFSLQSLSAAQAEEVERALWAAVRALDEAAGLSHRVASAMSGAMRDRFLEREKDHRAHARVVRDILLRGDLLSPQDSAAIGTAGSTMPARPGSNGAKRRRPGARARRQRST
jgi:two-component system chemotaxis response regulator CheB